MCDGVLDKEGSQQLATGEWGQMHWAGLLVTPWGISLKLERCLVGREPKVNKSILIAQTTEFLHFAM